MERVEIQRAKEIMGLNFIGIDEINLISKNLGLSNPNKIEFPLPIIPFTEENLKLYCDDYILILTFPFTKTGEPLTINYFRNIFGLDPKIYEPCFYNQDWYINESFANSVTLQYEWHLIRKNIYNSSRSIHPTLFNNYKLPSALLIVYTFFSWFFSSSCNEILWPNDYIWCIDLDHNYDQVYVGRYYDKFGQNKNGFSIHRFLKINMNYGVIDLL